MIDQEARRRIAELEAQIGQLRGLAGGLQGVLRQLTDGRITTLHQHPFTPNVNYDQPCGDWELVNPDPVIGLPDSPILPGTPGDGNLLYFCDNTTGRLFRSRNILAAATAVVYEDLGVIDPNGIRHIALDPWNPKNAAMAIGDRGLWKTTNLDDAIPAHTNLIDKSGTDYHLYHTAGSIKQKDLWLAVGYLSSGGTSYVRGWRSFDGAAFSEIDGIAGESSWCRCELSSHDADLAWITLGKPTASFQVSRTADFTVAPPTKPTWALTALFGNAWGTYIPPASYHRYTDNSGDLTALYGGFENGTGKIQFCTADVASCTKVALDGKVRAVGGYTWGGHVYWVLTSDKFYISDDGITWTLQYTFTGGQKWCVSGWPYDPELFYVTNNSSVHPILISRDRGLTWQAQTGNWASLGYTGDIQCCVPVWVA